MNILRAHTPNSRGTWHGLEEHLVDTAELAERFCRPFGAADFGSLIGIAHDLGKSQQGFQDYLEACFTGRSAKKCSHALPAAAYLYFLCCRATGATRWPEVSMPVLGHHGGLPAEAVTEHVLRDWWDDAKNTESKRAIHLLAQRLMGRMPVAARCEDPHRRELFIRMLFSALVDADFLSTESHFDPGLPHHRSSTARPADLWPLFRADQVRTMANARGDSFVNSLRRKIYREAMQRAGGAPGVYRLTVPTGGGKTRCLLGFALRHAARNRLHGFQRVIIALPYTSIIDQNARVYRGILGDRFVLEHHSQEYVGDDIHGEVSIRHRLASENWDFPVVVTTTVQLFESLFSNKPSRCRKLHNLARSIIVLDEVQTLPPELLAATADALRTLVDDYGVSLVLSSATQPAIDQTPYLKAFQGVTIHEIVRSFPTHFHLLRRVNYEPIRQAKDLAEIADDLLHPEQSQTLVVLNTRRASLALLEALRIRKAEGLYHLSTLLCGVHRKRVLDVVKERLSAGLPVRLVSTQVVEAGVDLDFPVVYRAMGPLDRIIQAAGRCNREGRRETLGRVVVFDYPENKTPPQAYRVGTDDTRILLGRVSIERLHDPQLCSEYFQALYRDVDLDKRRIQEVRRERDYPETAARYRLIEDTMSVVVVAYDKSEGERRLSAYLSSPSRETWRAVVPYVVNVSRHEQERVQQYMEEAGGGFFRWSGRYDECTGIIAECDPWDLIA